MGKLIYSMIASLDGYVADADGNFDWAEPDEEVHNFANDLLRPCGTYLYGRRMYEVMSAWETMGVEGDPPPIRDFGEIWRAADKVVYSTTLPGVATAKTRLERAFDVEAVRVLKEGEQRDLAIAGPGLTAHAIRAGLVDEYQVLAVPYIAGGGTAWLPAGLRTKLELLEERVFPNGTVYLRYRPVAE